MEVDYLGSDLHIHQLFYTGTSWNPVDLTATAGAPAATSNSPLATDYNSLAKTMEVDYLGSDLHIHQLFYTGTSWNPVDLTASAGAPAAAANSPLVTDYNSLAKTMEVDYLGSDLHIHQLFYTGTSWNPVDLTASAGAPAAAANSPLATDYNSLAKTMEVDYLGSDLHIHQLYYTGTSWNAVDLTASAGAPAALSGSPLTADLNQLANTMEVDYLGSDLHIHQLFYTGTSWNPVDLTASAGAPAAE
jgi:hypothetical protein